MSQWNNGYAYNNQYQDPNACNGDVNGHYSNQNPSYYPEMQYQNQYVSFDQFLAQMQPQRNADYSDAQYQNYTMNQYNNYTAMPSSSQNQYNYGAGSSTNEPKNGETFNAPATRNGVVEGTSNYQDEVTFHSNLTATATEFVPKSTKLQTSKGKYMSEASSSQDPEQLTNHNFSNQEDAQNSYNKPFSTSNNRSENSNWRERASSSQKHKTNEEGQQKRSSLKKDTNRVQDTDSRNRESSPGTQKFEDSKQDPKNGTGKANKNSKGKNRDADSARTFYNSKSNPDARTAIETDSRSPRNQRDQNSRPIRNDNPRSARNNEARSSNNEYYRSERDHESKSARDQSSRTGRDSELRSSDDRDNESRGRDNDSRSKYNEPRSRGEVSRRNYAGSQRVRPERNIVDDEQFANTYVPYREDNNGERERKYGERNRNYGDRDKNHMERDRYYDREKDRGDRNKSSGVNSPLRQQKLRRNNKLPYDSEMGMELTQRERLTEQLDKGTLECLVCCDRVQQTNAVWSCQNCYHVFHLNCIRKWAISSSHEGKWRCPACQNTSATIPREYRCMCGASANPEYQRGAGGAHTCGGPCRRPRACVHPCTLRCHPGPCPPCQATVTRQCGCGAETRSVLCSSKLAQECGRVCSRPLNCKVHNCAKECHEGPCEDCVGTVTQVCYCPSAQSRSVPCTGQSAGQSEFACGATCGRVLACGAHVCHAPCHPPPCAPCALLPELVDTCPCGSLRLSKVQRKSCTDPIPLCGGICARPLPCGPIGDKHFCKVECHHGDCPVCPDKTLMACRCGHASREVPCADLLNKADPVICQKKCNKKLSCGRHRCRSLCCVDESHRCGAVCGRTLSCQLHRCEQLCHTGHCAPCPIVSFEELYCECGREVLFPPVRCGVRPPVCTAPCRRTRECGHEPHHSCHAGPCPPCVVLTTKRCFGGHEERKTIPCSQEEFSCGMACGKPLPCGKHTCIKVCHKGPCDTGKCTQPCAEVRPACGHPCGAACHSSAAGECPSPAPCRRPVRATCQCTRRSAERPCHENARDRAKMLSTLAATKMADGGAVDLSDLNRPANQLKTLECDDECRLEQRNRQMALALQIRNPDVSAKLAPRYSEHTRQWATRDPAFAAAVHDQLTQLVQKAKKSKQKTRAHSFPSMNRAKRQFVHELCEHFGCESVAYDDEPNRNVVATADREKSWLPAMSVLEVLQREAGKRRVPGPVLRPAPSTAAAARPSSGWATLTSTKNNAWAARSQPAPAPTPKIDYFDNPPE